MLEMSFCTVYWYVHKEERVRRFVGGDLGGVEFEVDVMDGFKG